MELERVILLISTYGNKNNHFYKHTTIKIHSSYASLQYTVITQIVSINYCIFNVVGLLLFAGGRMRRKDSGSVKSILPLNYLTALRQLTEDCFLFLGT